ncbi:MAG: hypothetical protein ACRCYU_17620 [Nocardioides sp.]
MSVIYRLAPAISARLVGAGVVALALAVFVVTGLVLVFGLPTGLLWTVALVGVGVTAGWAWYVVRVAVVELDDAGYRVRFLRPGVAQGRWADVEDVVSATLSGTVCLVLRRRDGGSTAIPVGALAGDRDGFAEEVRRCLSRGQGLRPLS